MYISNFICVFLLTVWHVSGAARPVTLILNKINKIRNRLRFDDVTVSTYLVAVFFIEMQCNLWQFFEVLTFDQRIWYINAGLLCLMTFPLSTTMVIYS